MKGTIPTLTVDGFVTNKSLQMIKLFEYFLASDYSQSNTFHGSISSLKYILTMNPAIEDLRMSIIRTLTELYAAHYDSVNVIVDVEDEATTSVIIYTISIIAVYGGSSFSLSKNIKTSNANIVNFELLLDELYSEYNI